MGRAASPEHRYGFPHMHTLSERTRKTGPGQRTGVQPTGGAGSAARRPDGPRCLPRTPLWFSAYSYIRKARAEKPLQGSARAYIREAMLTAQLGGLMGRAASPEKT